MAFSSIRIGDLEINQDLDVQRKTWVLQRIGWAGMAVIILAALVGFFGSGGPMARMAVTDDDRMVSLERTEQIKYAVMEVGGGISVIPK